MVEQAAGSIVPAPEAPLVRAARFLKRFRKMPIIPSILLGIFIFAGITAPWIAPHDPELGDLRDRNLPPVWMNSETTVKTVVERLSISERATQITLRNARAQQPEAQLGDQIEVVAKAGGSTKFLLGTSGAGTMLPAAYIDPRIRYA